MWLWPLICLYFCSYQEKFCLPIISTNPPAFHFMNWLVRKFTVNPNKRHVMLFLQCSGYVSPITACSSILGGLMRLRQSETIIESGSFTKWVAMKQYGFTKRACFKAYAVATPSVLTSPMLRKCECECTSVVYIHAGTFTYPHILCIDACPPGCYYEHSPSLFSKSVVLPVVSVYCHSN